MGTPITSSPIQWWSNLREMTPMWSLHRIWMTWEICGWKFLLKTTPVLLERNRALSRNSTSERSHSLHQLHPPHRAHRKPWTLFHYNRRKRASNKWKSSLVRQKSMTTACHAIHKEGNSKDLGHLSMAMANMKVSTATNKTPSTDPKSYHNLSLFPKGTQINEATMRRYKN